MEAPFREHGGKTAATREPSGRRASSKGFSRLTSSPTPRVWPVRPRRPVRGWISIAFPFTANRHGWVFCPLAASVACRTSSCICAEINPGHTRPLGLDGFQHDHVPVARSWRPDRQKLDGAPDDAQTNSRAKWIDCSAGSGVVVVFTLNRPECAPGPAVRRAIPRCKLTPQLYEFT